MHSLCLFAGTTEGRQLAEYLACLPCEVYACVATEYGEVLLPKSDKMAVSAERLDRAQMKALFEQKRFDLVIDATHPYAKEATANIKSVCELTNTKYLRLLRESGQYTGGRWFDTIEEAVSFLQSTEGNILVTTGAKELVVFTKIDQYSERWQFRVWKQQKDKQNR